jgi:hypothetical protein
MEEILRRLEVVERMSWECNLERERDLEGG